MPWQQVPFPTGRAAAPSQDIMRPRATIAATNEARRVPSSPYSHWRASSLRPMSPSAAGSRQAQPHGHVVYSPRLTSRVTVGAVPMGRTTSASAAPKLGSAVLPVSKPAKSSGFSGPAISWSSTLPANVHSTPASARARELQRSPSNKTSVCQATSSSAYRASSPLRATVGAKVSQDTNHPLMQVCDWEQAKRRLEQDYSILREHDKKNLAKLEQERVKIRATVRRLESKMVPEQAHQILTDAAVAAIPESGSCQAVQQATPLMSSMASSGAAAVDGIDRGISRVTRSPAPTTRAHSPRLQLESADSSIALPVRRHLSPVRGQRRLSIHEGIVTADRVVQGVPQGIATVDGVRRNLLDGPGTSVTVVPFVAEAPSLVTTVGVQPATAACNRVGSITVPQVAKGSTTLPGAGGTTWRTASISQAAATPLQANMRSRTPMRCPSPRDTFGGG